MLTCASFGERSLKFVGGTLAWNRAFGGAKLLPKEGGKFNAVVQALRDAGVDTMAADYADLRKVIVSWYHEHILTERFRESIMDTTLTLLPSSAWEQPLGGSFPLDTAGCTTDWDPCLAGDYVPSPLIDGF